MSSSTAAPNAPWQRVRLAQLGALAARGADTVRFLQGQLSNDVEQLSAARSQLTALHNPQGRAIALLRLVQLAAQGQPPEVLALLPRELAAPVASRLVKFVLRSKVSIREESDAWQVHGLVAPLCASEGLDGAAVPLPQDVNGQAILAGCLAVRVPGERPRWLVIAQAGAPWPSDLPQTIEADHELWQRLDIEAGVPQIRAATSEGFVAQMLNLDLLDAVSFDKGCYTGQEVIARAHWRGRVKRRLQRFVARGPVQLAPGDTRTLTDGRGLTVVDAVAREDGRCELLGVTALPAAQSEEPATDAPPTDAAARLEVESLPLPYALPT